MVGRSRRERRNLRQISAYYLCSSQPARNSAATVRSAWERADALRPDRSAIRRLRSGPVASPRRVPFAVRSATAAVFRAGGTAHGRPLVRLVVGAATRPARRRRLRSRMHAAWLGRNTSRRHPACLRGASGVPCGPGRLPSPRRPSRPVRYRPCRPFTVQARDARTYPLLAPREAQMKPSTFACSHGASRRW